MATFLSTRQAAEELGVTTQTIRRWIKVKRLLAIRRPGETYRIPAQAVIVFRQNAGLLPPADLHIPSIDALYPDQVARKSSVLTPADVAAELGISEGAVAGLILRGLLFALEPLVSGDPVRIPAPALDAYKRKVGLLPPIPRSTGPAHVETILDLPDFYRRAIEPRLRELDLSAEDVLLRAAEDRVFARGHRRLLGDLARYANWVVEGVGSGASCTPIPRSLTRDHLVLDDPDSGDS
jgi:excisionase family DNA binding protein